MESKLGHATISWRYPNQWELDEYGPDVIKPNDRILVAIRPACQEDFPDEDHPELPELRTLLTTMPYSSYLHTPEWEARRVAALARAGYRCQLCNRQGELHVHHRTYDRRGEESSDDLTVLCASCHHEHHEREKVRALVSQD